jgi:hypothetical protein
MSSLLLLLPTTKYGYGGARPPQFDLGRNSTIDNTSSLDNVPPFSSYADPYLRRQVPTQLSRGNKRLPHYLDNPPK